MRTGWPEDLHASHTFFAPSAWPLEQGHGYYQNSYLLMHSAWYAPLKGVSIGGGFELTSMVSSIRNKERNPGFFLGMKMSTEVGGGVHVGVVAIGASFSHGAFASEEEALPDRVGIVAAQVTAGAEDTHGTFSFGWGATADGLTDDPLFGFSGQVRVMDRLAIVTENWLLRFGKEPLNIYSLGARFLHRRLAFDGGLIHNKQFVGKLSPLMPYVGFAWWL